MFSSDVTWCVGGAWETPRRGPAGSSSLRRSIAVTPASPVTLSADPSWAVPQLAMLQAQDKGPPSIPAQGCSLRGPLSSTAEGPLVPTWDPLPHTTLQGQAVVPGDLVPGIMALPVTGMSRDLWGQLGTVELSLWSQAS